MVYTTSISHPNMFSTVTGETIVDTALESINRCISLLILTGFTELFGNPAFGSGIYEAQFETTPAGEEITFEVSQVMLPVDVDFIFDYEIVVE